MVKSLLIIISISVTIFAISYGVVIYLNQSKAKYLENVFIPTTDVESEDTTKIKKSMNKFNEFSEEQIDKEGFYLRIDKISLFKKVILNVDPRDKSKYVDSWNYGISHGMFTSTPDKIGITYLFAHALGSKENAVDQNAWFSYMDELSMNDEVIIYYQGKKYTYIVSSILAIKPTATGYYTGSSPVSMVRMQYCGPPTGSLDSRTIVDAVLIDTQDFTKALDDQNSSSLN